MTLPAADDRSIAPAAILAVLYWCGLTLVLVESGPGTLLAFMDAGLVARRHLLVTPLLLGPGKPGLALAPITGLAAAVCLRVRRYALGEDTLSDCLFPV